MSADPCDPLEDLPCPETARLDECARRLTAALDLLSAHLAAADAGAAGAIEVDLERLVPALAAARPSGRAGDRALSNELERVRRAVGRCRGIGTAIAECAGAAMAAGGMPSDYGRSGETRAIAASPTVEARA